MSPIPYSLLPPEAKGLVFDCDGTLIDSMETHLAAWGATCEEFGLSITRSLMGENAGVPMDVLFDLVMDHSGKAQGSVDRVQVGRTC